MPKMCISDTGLLSRSLIVLHFPGCTNPYKSVVQTFTVVQLSFILFENGHSASYMDSNIKMAFIGIKIGDIAMIYSVCLKSKLC